jgi:biotin carboxyl carrier protein
VLNKFLKNKDLTSFNSYRFLKRSSLHPKAIKRVALFFFVCIILILLLPWVQTVRGYGRVIAFSPNERGQSVDATITGRLGKWHVEEGSFVNEGDPIVEILDNDPNILIRLNQERTAILKKFEAATIGQKTSKLNLDRQEELMNKGLASKRDFEKARLEYTKLIAEEAKVSAELAKIDTSIARQTSQRISAPMSGYIQRRKSGLGGQIVKAGTELAFLVPKTQSRSVEIWIDGNDVPIVHEGDKVRIQFEGWPAIQSFGWPSLAVGTFGGVISYADSFVREDGKSRVLIKPDPNERPWPSSQILRQGVRSYAWILLNDVSLGFELWRNFNGFPLISTTELLEKDKNLEEKK